MRWARLVAIVPALALGWASVYAVELGTAGEIALGVGEEMSAWSEGTKAQPAPERLAAMRADLERAQGRTPADPAPHELLGLLDARSLDSQEYPGQAGVHFSRALVLRPTAPNAWANIVAVRYRGGDTGPVFEAALVNAARMGPHEPEVQRVVANYGLAVYDEVAPATRRAIGAMVAAGMKRKPLELLQIADKRGRLGVACSHLAGIPRPTDSKWTQPCQSLEATP